jgi:SUMO ligase MMS21 Smc5/6 complex component
VADALIAASVAAEATCPITMEPITAATAAVTSCFHVFEANAIAIWLTDHQTCPTCKQAAILSA